MTYEIYVNGEHDRTFIMRRNNMYYVIYKDVCVYNTITIQDANRYIREKGYRIMKVTNRVAGGVFIEVL